MVFVCFLHNIIGFIKTEHISVINHGIFRVPVADASSFRLN